MGDVGFHSGDDLELVVGVKVGKMGKVVRIREKMQKNLVGIGECL